MGLAGFRLTIGAENAAITGSDVRERDVLTQRHQKPATTNDPQMGAGTPCLSGLLAGRVSLKREALTNSKKMTEKPGTQKCCEKSGPQHRFSLHDHSHFPADLPVPRCCSWGERASPPNPGAKDQMECVTPTTENSHRQLWTIWASGCGRHQERVTRPKWGVDDATPALNRSATEQNLPARN
jgi:hypothetical protein